MMQKTIYALLSTTAPVAFASQPGAYQHTPADVSAVREARAGEGAGWMNTDAMMKRSKDSAAMIEYWDLTDTIVDGIAALRAAGTKYLPKFADEDQESYEYRLKCTKLTNIYRDTVENLSSKPFEQEVGLVLDDDATAPEFITQFIENVDGSGNNLTVFAGATFFNGINSAIDWIFVDFDKPDPTIRTRADEKRAGLRPYWSHVLGRNILDPRSKVINGEETLVYLRIYEPGDPDRIRVFKRDETGLVRWAVFEKTAQDHDVKSEWMPDDYLDAHGKTRFVLDDQGTVSINVIPLVPFITGRRDGRSWRFFPAMRDAADLQVELYQQESGLKFAKNLTAYPMLAGNGVRPEKDEAGNPKKLRVGPSRVLYAPPDNNGNTGSWAYVEPNAQSLKFLADDIKETMQQLRELGRQPLTAQSGNLTVITTAVAASKAKSAVGAWALQLKDSLENALVLTCKWMGITKEQYDPTVDVYTEFDEFTDGKDTDALNSARERKDISQRTYWDELKRRRILSDEFDPEVEEQRLLDELPGDGEDTGDPDDDPPAPDPEPGITDPPEPIG